MFAQAGIEDANQRSAAPLTREFQVRQADGGQLFRLAPGEVLDLDVGVVGAQVRLRQGTPLGAAQRFGLGRARHLEQSAGGRGYRGDDFAMLFRKCLLHDANSRALIWFF